MRSPILIYANWPWSEDRREGHCPIEFNIHTRRWYVLVRPFSKAQAYDHLRGCWTAHPVIWRHIVIRPENPEIWESLHERGRKVSPELLAVIRAEIKKDRDEFVRDMQEQLGRW